MSKKSSKLASQILSPRNRVSRFEYNIHTKELRVTYMNGDFTVWDKVEAFEFFGPRFDAELIGGKLEVNFRFPGGFVVILD